MYIYIHIFITLVFMGILTQETSPQRGPHMEFRKFREFRSRQSAEEPWYATVVLKGSATQGERLEGAALGQSAQAQGTLEDPTENPAF